MPTPKSTTTPIGAGLSCLALSLFSIYITFSASSYRQPDDPAIDLISSGFMYFIGYLSTLLIVFIILVFTISVLSSARRNHAFLKPNPILCALSFVISLICFLVLTI